MHLPSFDGDSQLLEFASSISFRGFYDLAIEILGFPEGPAIYSGLDIPHSQAQLLASVPVVVLSDENHASGYCQTRTFFPSGH